MKVTRFTVIYESDEDGFVVASVPSIPGCYTQGKTLEEAKKRIAEVIKMCLKEQSDYTQQTTPNFIGIDTVTIKHA